MQLPNIPVDMQGKATVFRFFSSSTIFSTEL